jgi:stringent starvation protein B
MMRWLHRARVESAARDGRGPKRYVVEAMLERGPVRIYLDARRDGVKVPDALASDPELVLRFGNRLVPPIVDLALDAHAISGTLSFRGQPFHVVVPWHAVVAALVEGEREPATWPLDLPVARVRD